MDAEEFPGCLSRVLAAHPPLARCCGESRESSASAGIAAWEKLWRPVLDCRWYWNVGTRPSTKGTAPLAPLAPVRARHVSAVILAEELASHGLSHVGEVLGAELSDSCKCLSGLGYSTGFLCKICHCFPGARLAASINPGTTHIHGFSGHRHVSKVALVQSEPQQPRKLSTPIPESLIHSRTLLATVALCRCRSWDQTRLEIVGTSHRKAWDTRTSPSCSHVPWVLPRAASR